MEVILKIGILGFGAIFGYLFGEVDLLVKVLVCFIVADYISGLLASGYLGELSSKMGFKGIAKKIAILILVAIAHQIDLILGTHNTTRDAVIFFYLANELISILENFVRMGMKVPEVLKNLILIFDSKSGDEEEKHDKDMD
ncbi:holin family protein [Listeria monocytogenes]|uniref:Holin family protein n=1 Tax=Listeria monocytogenes TaxID=1639 RepID=A0A3D7XJA2_LISMN|nr:MULTISPECIES: holin family protein [Listeria]EAC6522104.1 holin family protein [Listeria monocytogenes serotype 4b]EAE1679597.1 holin family protein [Listeria monocytogenes LIS0071]EAF4565830.1 holin family protein [Listeria monocytogenes serotype 1/2a]EAG6333436.1 holin family protein [Listeria monocytogenes CFSAN002346]EAG6351475.1 holin family protein [Listeria monocytogenes LIS0102]EAG6373885.1 holin family protein [Listeria monocytogenes CFSAN002356]EAG6378404.1 holin family protein 